MEIAAKGLVFTALFAFPAFAQDSAQLEGAAADSFVAELAPRVSALCERPRYLDCMEITEAQCRENAPATALHCQESTKAHFKQSRDRNSSTGFFFGCVVGKHLGLTEKKVATKVYCLKQAT